MGGDSRGRMFPARVLVPHEQRKPTWYHMIQIFLLFAPFPGTILFLFGRARWRYWRNQRRLRRLGLLDPQQRQTPAAAPASAATHPARLQHTHNLSSGDVTPPNDMVGVSVDTPKGAELR